MQVCLYSLWKNNNELNLGISLDYILSPKNIL